MFDKAGIKEYVGMSSGNSYMSGLNSIETIFNVSIDDEIIKDNCTDLLEKLNSYKNELGITDSQKHARTNFYSHLKKYVEYKNQSGVSEETRFETAISDIIKSYKLDFERVNKEERYKWIARKWYIDHWNIDAEDFATMYETAFKEASNLLRSGNYYPYKMATDFAKAEPETARSLFKMLYDESIPLEQRFIDFRAGFEKYFKPLNLNHYQDLHAISVYLTFEYPEKYFIYKYTVYDNFRKLIGFDEKPTASKVFSIESNNRMCEYILSVIKKNNVLIQMSKNRLGDNCYKDEPLHFLAQDVEYYGSKLKVTVPEGYWPSLEEYNPEITEEMWIEVLNDSEVTTTENLRMFKMMLEQGGESTCANLAEIYGNVHNYYNSLGKNFGVRVKNKINCPACIDKGVERFFVIPFVGRDVMEKGHDRFTWKLRYELEQALKNIDLSNIDITVKDNTSITDISKNTILYGPPGTGKTYNTAIYAVAIIENKPLEVVKQEEYDAVLERYNAYKQSGLIEFTTFHQSYGYEEFIEGIKPVINDGCGDVQYKVMPGLFKIFCEKAEQSINIKNHVFIIDEINRGNISKIFGELITLIEPTKRLGQAEEMTVKLPYSLKPFGVPDNAYIIGTMNTADRSIAAIDTALRRRFQFKEMQPNANVLEGIMVDDISIKEMLWRMNKRISVLYDREHTIGHAYFMPLKDSPTIEVLADIFRNNIIPLLQEYFYEDYEKIRLVLGDNNKPNETEQFIIAKDNNYGELFGNTDYGFDEACTYEINADALGSINSYRSI